MHSIQEFLNFSYSFTRFLDPLLVEKCDSVNGNLIFRLLRTETLTFVSFTNYIFYKIQKYAKVENIQSVEDFNFALVFENKTLEIFEAIRF